MAGGDYARNEPSEGYQKVNIVLSKIWVRQVNAARTRLPSTA